MDVTAESLAGMFGEIFPHLDERQRRLVMGAQVRRWAMAGSGWWPGPPGSVRPRSRWGRPSWTRALSRWAGPGARAGVPSG